MIVKRVLNIEDTTLKNVAITRALNKAGVPFVDWAKNGDDGIEMVENSIKNDKPYDLIITDMHFSIFGKDDIQAGTKVIEELRRRNIEMPVVVCSSHPYQEPLAVDNIYFNERSRDIDWDIREMLDRLRQI